MKRSTILLIGALLQFISFTALSQNEETTTENKDAVETKDLKPEPNYNGPLFKRPLAVAVQLGTQGIGLEGKLGIKRQWNIRFGGDYIPGKFSHVTDVQNLNVNFDLESKFFNLHLLADWKPFRKSAFRLTGGFAYFVSGEATMKNIADGTFKYGDLTVPASEIGELDIKSDWKGIAPYLGVGFCKDFPKQFNVSLDFGTYYLSKPKIDLSSSKMLSGNEANQSIIEENMKGYRWLPVIQMNFTYKLN